MALGRQRQVYIVNSETARAAQGDAVSKRVRMWGGDSGVKLGLSVHKP